jgi:hypothetical protein
MVADRRVSDVCVRPVTPDLWPTLERFFGPAGAYSNCWCTFFRQPAKAFSAGCHDDGVDNKDLMRRLTLEGGVPGLLAFRDDEPAGWVSVAPRDQFVRVTNSRLLCPPDDDGRRHAGVWSVVCFWTPKTQRGSGVADTLLAAAVAHAYEGGARVVEGYPVDTAVKWPGRAAIYHGTVSLFARAGFRVVRRPSPTRAVMRHARDGAKPRPEAIQNLP